MILVIILMASIIAAYLIVHYDQKPDLDPVQRAYNSLVDDIINIKNISEWVDVSEKMKKFEGLSFGHMDGEGMMMSLHELMDEVEHKLLWDKGDAQ